MYWPILSYYGAVGCSEATGCLSSCSRTLQHASMGERGSSRLPRGYGTTIHPCELQPGRLNDITCPSAAWRQAFPSTLECGRSEEQQAHLMPAVVTWRVLLTVRFEHAATFIHVDISLKETLLLSTTSYGLQWLQTLSHLKRMAPHYFL